MKFNASAIAASLLLALTVSTSQAQVVQGYVYLPIPAQTDVLVSVPLNNASEGDYTVAGVSGGIISVSEAIDGTFAAGKYYVRFLDGSAAGLWTTITANNSTSVTLENASIAGLAAMGDHIRVFKHRTVGDVFPASLLGASFVNGTQILLFNNNATGQNKSAFTTLSYLAAVKNWLGAQGADTVLPPDSLFTIRNNSDAALTYIAIGQAPDYPVSFMVPTNLQNDLLLGTGYPVTTNIGQTNFGGVNGRQILLFNNAQTGKNKASSATINYILGLGWLGQQGAATELVPTNGFVFRQNGGAGGVVKTVKPY